MQLISGTADAPDLLALIYQIELSRQVPVFRIIVLLITGSDDKFGISVKI